MLQSAACKLDCVHPCVDYRGINGSSQMQDSHCIGSLDCWMAVTDYERLLVPKLQECIDKALLSSSDIARCSLGL